MSLQELRSNFAKFLKDQQIKSGLVSKKTMDRLSVDEIINSCRIDHRTDEEIMTNEQMNNLIMENNSETVIDIINETLQERFDNERLMNIKNNLSDKIVRIKVPEIIISIIEKLDFKIEEERVKELIDDLLIIYPYWILDETYYDIDNNSLIERNVPYRHLLISSLSNYDTFKDWMEDTLTGEYKEDNKKISFQTISKVVIEKLSFGLCSLFENKESAKYKKIFEDLTDESIKFILNMPLIAIWEQYEFIARKHKENEEKLLNEIEEMTKKNFSEFIDKGVKTSQKTYFIDKVKSLLLTMNQEQIFKAYQVNFGLDMTRNVEKEFDLIMLKAIENE